MGVVSTIDYENFPKQGKWLGRRVEVCYKFDTTKCHYGTIVRDDVDHPYQMIIKLDNGRYVLSTECQFGLAKKEIE